MHEYNFALHKNHVVLLNKFKKNKMPIRTHSSSAATAPTASSAVSF